MLSDDEERGFFRSRPSRTTKTSWKPWFLSHGPHRRRRSAQIALRWYLLDCWTFMPAPSPLNLGAGDSRTRLRSTGQTSSRSPPISCHRSGVCRRRASGSYSSGSPRGHNSSATHRCTLAVEASDTGDGWSVTFGPERVETVSGSSPADHRNGGRGRSLSRTLEPASGRSDPVRAVTATSSPKFREKLHIRWA